MPFEPKFVDLVRNHSTTTGTGNFTLGPAVNGFASLATAVSVGDRFYYSAIGVDKPAEREVGRGTLLAGGIVARETISGPKTNFTSGTKAIALIAAAEWFTTVQADLGAGGAADAVTHAATRAALAALSTSGGPAFLREARREGVFVFDGANLSAQVAADPAQGVYVAPASDVTGATGAWVRKFSGPIDIRWFGAVADCTALGAGTDNAAAINGAIAVAALLKGGEILVPRSTLGYRVASSITITGGVKLCGQGFSQSPGGAFPSAHRASLLVFDTNTAGLKFFAFTDNAANNQVIEFESSSYSVVEDLFVYGGGGTAVAAHGIEVRTAVNFRNVRIENFAGNGLFITADTAGPNPYGNANCSGFSRIMARYNGCHGIRIKGGDSNACLFENCDTSFNGGAGVLDDTTIGGNTYIGHHCNSNNQSNGESIPQETQVQSEFAGLSDANCGSIIFTNAAETSHVVVGAYVEDSFGKLAHLPAGVLVLGGLLARAGYHSATSAPMVLDSDDGVAKIGTIKSTGSGGVVPVAATIAFNADLGWGGVSGDARINYSSNSGLVMGGAGASEDFVLFNKLGQSALWVPTGTRNITVGGNVAAIGAVSGSNLSGTNSGDQTIVLTGDVTGSGSGSFAATIGANKVTFAKFVAASAASLVGASAAGNFAELTPASARSVLGLAAIAASGSGADLSASSVTYAKIQNVAASSLVGNPTGSAGAPSEISLAGGLSFSGTTLTAAGALTPTSMASSGAVTSSAATAGVGYATGAGGTVTQATNKSTGVTLNKACGAITMNNAALAANTTVTFTLTNSAIAANDTLVLNHGSGGTAGAYTLNAQAGAGSATVNVRNVTAGSLSEAIVIRYAIIKGVAA